MRFAHPDASWLLLLVALLAVALWRGERVRRGRLLRLAQAGLLPPLVAEASDGRRRIRHVLVVSSCVLLVVALARPQAGTKVELERTRGVNVVIALDVSRSMLARDVRPDRLRRAQMELADLLESLRGNRVGLVAFAGVAYAPCPLTTDTGAAKLFLRHLGPDAVPQGGTALGRALATARALFKAESRADTGQPTSRRAANILVLVTDGEDHEGDLEAEAAALREQSIHLYAVGVGSALGEPIPVPPSGTPVAGGASQAYLRDRDGQTVLTRLNEPVLRKLAEDAGGTYVASPQGGLGLEEVKAGIAATQKAELENRLAVSYDERYPWALGPSVACLLVARAIRLRRREDPRAAAAAGAVRVAS